MKLVNPLFLILFLTFVASCSQNLPENYGIYAYTDKGKITLSGQKIHFTGNLLQSITGLKGASGVKCNSIKNFIVFEQDINPKSIKISKLEFKKGGYVQNIFNKTYVDVNLWTVAKNINFDVAPISGKKDMYRLTTKENLSEGFYALHFGGLEATEIIEAVSGNIAYDIVIGKIEDYQSYEVIKKHNEEKLKAEAENLLKNMNNYFNNKDYIKMKEVYRPDNKILSDSEWQEFTNGLATWLNSAGKVIESNIVSSNISDNEGIFQIQTIYEKKGQQNEKIVVRNLEGKYFITSLE